MIQFNIIMWEIEISILTYMFYILNKMWLILPMPVCVFYLFDNIIIYLIQIQISKQKIIIHIQIIQFNWFYQQCDNYLKLNNMFKTVFLNFFQHQYYYIQSNLTKIQTIVT